MNVQTYPYICSYIYTPFPTTPNTMSPYPQHHPRTRLVCMCMYMLVYTYIYIYVHILTFLYAFRAYFPQSRAREESQVGRRQLPGRRRLLGRRHLPGKQRWRGFPWGGQLHPRFPKGLHFHCIIRSKCYIFIDWELPYILKMSPSCYYKSQTTYNKCL